MLKGGAGLARRHRFLKLGDIIKPTDHENLADRDCCH
jgi:hypothetical protein